LLSCRNSSNFKKQSKKGRIVLLIEKVEIATNIRLNPLSILDQRHEIGFVSRTVKYQSNLYQNNVLKRVKLGITRIQLELTDIIGFENIPLQSRIQELYLKPKESNSF
jgi:hypothetical protein